VVNAPQQDFRLHLLRIQLTTRNQENTAWDMGFQNLKRVLDCNSNFIQCHTNIIAAIIGIGANPVKHYI
jgi:hypothetical protein